MLGLRKISTGNNKAVTSFISRNYVTVKRRPSTKVVGVEFGKKLDFKNLDKVEPIQPKPYTPTAAHPNNDQRLTNIISNRDKEDKFYYSPNFSKLGVLTNINELNEEWGYFKGDDRKGAETGSTFTISTKSKIEIGKNANGLSVPFPRISGQGAPLVSVPSMHGQTYNRGMLNNRSTLNALDMTTMGQIEHFIRIQIANDIVSAYSIHTTTPGVIQCGGLDFINLYESKNNSQYLSTYFKKVSKMFYLMSIAPKPQISIVDGLAVGAGVGLTANSGFRVGSENAIVTVPDCAIGFFPNSGNIRLLNRLEDGIGLYLALTGRRIRGVELVQAGVTDFFIPTNMIPSLDDCLSRLPLRNHKRLIENVIGCTTQVFTELNGRVTHIEQYRDAIKRCFENKKTIEQVIDALEKEDDKSYDWAQRCIKNINRCSPISIKLTMRLFNESPTDMPSNKYYERDYNISLALASDTESDLWEGIRSNLIESREPVWKHKSYKDVDDKLIDDIINYNPEGQTALKLAPFKTTYLMYEDILNEYFNSNQFTLSEEDQTILTSHTGYPFTKDYEDSIEIFYKGGRSDVYQQDRNTADIFREMDEIDVATY
ncbi:hypothetical protein RB653_006938 [Dictyostelium firmibasis]|uniref:Enoyl-CoA hydratase/isomerase domain-containing protein n=1 Tax=Dictyostelium firmibasis TaxID=79012 RepID=A0AAN7TMI9_9MYCE